MLAVTTFHPEGWEKYAYRLLETLPDRFPGRVVAYHEEKPDFEHPKVEFRDWFSIPGASEYIEKLKRHPGADGRIHNGYDYRYDASKFCRKVFAQDAVFDEEQYVFWFDADCIVTDEFPESLLLGLFRDRPFCYLGRKGNHSYTETGFIGFDTKHPEFQAFRTRYLSYFTDGRIFGQLKGWHDCIAFDYARETVEGTNLTPQGRGMGNVLSDSELRNHVYHAKGNRKFEAKADKLFARV